MGEKTEKASPKKLRDARKKGQVAKSQDFPAAFTFIAAIAALLNSIGFIYDHVSAFTITAFKSITQNDLGAQIQSLYALATSEILLVSLPIAVLVSMVGVLVTFLTVGPTWAPEVFKFDIKKFDPIQNLKSKFKLKTLVELLKQMFKVSVAGFIVYTVMVKSFPVLTQMVGVSLIGALLIFHSFLLEVVVKVGLFFIAVAVFDLSFQKAQFAKEMKMEKFEVKQEYKNSEGDPQIKGKRRQIAQEIAYGGGGPEAGVKQAKAVVTNPTHLAVAVGYIKGVDAAPYVLAKGNDHQAEMIIKYADKYDVPVVRNIALAHRLWEDADLYEYIPEDTFKAMAEILQWVNSLNPDNQLGTESEVEL